MCITVGSCGAVCRSEMTSLASLRSLVCTVPCVVRSMSHAVLALGGNVGEVESTFRQALSVLGDHGVEVAHPST